MQGRGQAGTKKREPSAPAGDAAAADARTRAEQPAPATARFFHDALGVSVDEFLLDIADQRAYGPHAVAARLQAADMVAMADIDYMMNHVQFRGVSVQPIRKGEAESDRRTTDAGGAADAAYVYAQFAKGTSLRFLNVERYLPRVAGFAAELAAALAGVVNANMYVAPAGGEGLDRHYDTHDVFVLQCIGSKRWRLYADDYANTWERPIGHVDAFDPKKHPPGQVDRDLELTPGDILYLPRGTMHEVVPLRGDSLHVTFRLHTLTVGELAGRALRLAAAEVEELRTPVSHAMRLQAAVDDQLGAEIAGAVSSRYLAAALEGYRRECRQAQAPADHWFGSHRNAADGVARLGASIARRMRNLEVRGRTKPIQPKHRPRPNG